MNFLAEALNTELKEYGVIAMLKEAKHKCHELKRGLKEGECKEIINRAKVYIIPARGD